MMKKLIFCLMFVMCIQFVSADNHSIETNDYLEVGHGILPNQGILYNLDKAWDETRYRVVNTFNKEAGSRIALQISEERTAELLHSVGDFELDDVNMLIEDRYLYLERAETIRNTTQYKNSIQRQDNAIEYTRRIIRAEREIARRERYKNIGTYSNSEIKEIEEIKDKVEEVLENVPANENAQDAIDNALDNVGNALDSIPEQGQQSQSQSQNNKGKNKP